MSQLAIKPFIGSESFTHSGARMGKMCGVFFLFHPSVKDGEWNVKKWLKSSVEGYINKVFN